MRQLLAHRDARLFLGGDIVSMFGDTSLWLAAAIWVKSLTGSNSAAGLVFFAFGLPQLAAPLFGMVVDRVKRKPLLIAVNLVMGVAVLLLLLVHGRGDVWIIYLVMILYGASYGLLGPAQSALLTVLLPEDLLPAGNSLLQTFRQGMRLISPIVGAGIFAWRGGALVAMIDAATFGIAAVSLLLVRVQEVKPKPRELHWAREAVGGIQHVLGIPVLRQVVIATMLTVLVVGFSETLTFAVVTQGLHRPPAFIGVLLSFQGIGGIAGGLTAAAIMRRTGEGLLCGIGLACFAVGVPLWAVPNLPVVIVGILLLGVSLPWVIVAIMTLIQRMTPNELQGRAASALDLMIGVPQTLSIAVGAALAAVVSYQLLLVGMGAVIGVACLYLLTRKDQWERVPKPERAVAVAG